MSSESSQSACASFEMLAATHDGEYADVYEGADDADGYLVLMLLSSAFLQRRTLIVRYLW
jgi:hypothetical protein